MKKLMEVVDAQASTTEEIDFESMVGKKWQEVKANLIEHIFVDTQNVQIKTGDCIVDFDCCPFLSVVGTYKIENEELVIEIEDNALVYDNRG